MTSVLRALRRDIDLVLLTVIGLALIVVLFCAFGCEARVPLRPEVAQAAGVVAEPGKAAEVPLSAYATVEQAYRDAQEAKAKTEQAKAAEVASDLDWKVGQATKTVERQIRAMQEKLEDDLAAERIKAERAIKAIGVAVEKIKADTDRVVKMQAVEVKAAEQRQQVIDQVVGLGLSAANTAAATQGGTPWGGLLMGALGIAGAAFGAKQRGEAKKANSALDAVTSGIEEAHKAGLDAAVLKAVKAEIAKQAQPGDITTIETSIARQNYEAKV